MKTKTLLVSSFTVLYLLIGGNTQAQNFSFLKEEPSSEPILTYYEYRNGIQMIEVDYLGPWVQKIVWLETYQPRALEWSSLIPKPAYNLLLFRDEQGILLKEHKVRNQYYSDQRYKITMSQSTPQLAVPKESLKQARSHKASELTPIIRTFSRFNSKAGLIRFGSFPIDYTLHAQNFAGLYVVVDTSGRDMIIDSLVNIVFPPKYDIIIPVDSYYIVSLNGKWGLMNLNFEETTEIKYDHVFPSYPNRGYVDAQLNGKWGYVDPAGNQLTRFKYDDRIEDFKDGYAKVKSNNKYGFINRSGEEIGKVKYHHVGYTGPLNGNFIQGHTKVLLDRKYGIIDTTGKEVVPVKYDYMGIFSEGVVSAKVDNEWGFIGPGGRTVIPFTSDWDLTYTFFSSGLAKIKIRVDFHTSKYYFINKEGEKVFDYNGYYVHHFSEGRAMIQCKKGTFGFIDTTGKEVIPCKYSSANDFEDGKARVVKGNKSFLIDMNGNIIE